MIPNLHVGTFGRKPFAPVLSIAGVSTFRLNSSEPNLASVPRIEVSLSDLAKAWQATKEPSTWAKVDYIKMWEFDLPRLSRHSQRQAAYQRHFSERHGVVQPE